MPLLLYRHILVDLLKVFTLTAVVLVAVIAFGATIKPLTDGGILGPAEAVRYMLLAMVPMLQFALPFAAGFASTLVLHRMTNDNEIQAAAASGISYRRILAPIVALGLALTLAMVGLTQSIIPRIGSIMERIIAEDVARLLQYSIVSGTPARLGSLQIYADDLRIVDRPVDTEADTRLILFRVAVAELDSLGRIENETTASQAVVDVYRLGSDTYLKVAASESIRFEGGTGQRAGLGRAEGLEPIVIPSPTRHYLRARTRAQLLEMRRQPGQHHRVREARDALSREMLDRAIAQAIDVAIATRSEIEFVQQVPVHRSYVVQADAFVDGSFESEHGGPVVVQQFEGGRVLRLLAADEVRLSRSGRTDEDTPLFDLELLNVEVTDLHAGGLVNRRSRLFDSGLELTGLDLPPAAAQNVTEVRALEALMERARSVGAADGETGPIEDRIDSLKKEIDSLNKEITSRILARHAQATTAVLLLTLGATLAMLLRGSLPLVIYLWAFLPSILNLIMISGGDKMMRDGYLVSGASVMWGGNALLLLLLFIVFLRLSKN